MTDLMLFCLVVTVVDLGLVLLVLILRSQVKALEHQLYCEHDTKQCVDCGRVFRRKRPLRGC